MKRFYVGALSALLWAQQTTAEAKPTGSQSVGERQGDDFFAGDVAGTSGEPVPLGAVTNDAYPSSDLFTFTGLAAGVRLSAGGEWNGVWIVPRKDIRGLAFLSPKGLNAHFSIVITRAQMPSRPQQSLTVHVTLSNSVSASADAPPAAEPTAPRYIPSPSEKILLDKVAALLLRADISGARTILEYLVAKGDPKAALFLGETYDPTVLGKIDTKGVVSDKEKAIELYQKAQKLGSPEAKARLDALSIQ